MIWRSEPYAASRWIFLRWLGFIYVAAFLSLHAQVTGLIGARGILPAQMYLAAAKAQLGARAWTLLPTVFWFGASNGALRTASLGGAIAGLLVVLDVAPAAALAVCWLLYLSFMAVAGEFLGFQWDALLLETGFLAIFLASLHLRPKGGREPAPATLIVWLFRLLLARLMLLSGLVKVLSGDLTWRNATALRYHYETQPLPFWASWYFHHLPAAFQRFSSVATLVIELVVPLGLFAPVRWRRAACFVLAGFQVLILISGNFGFFNLLTIGLCVMAMDDGVWPERFRRWLAPKEGAAVARPWPRPVLASAGALVAMLTVATLWIEIFRAPAPVLEPVRRALSPFGIVNNYGLFAVMTTERPEIIVEGSNDGRTWTPYVFRYKPGDPMRRPALVTPHMPRLDWQMWFAALGNVQENRWFLNFCVRLLEGSPDVLDLMGRNPFPSAPPRFIRAELYKYRFSTAEERRASGAWWVRTPAGLYCPPFSLDDVRPRG